MWITGVLIILQKCHPQSTLRLPRANLIIGMVQATQTRTVWECVSHGPSPSLFQNNWGLSQSLTHNSSNQTETKNEVRIKGIQHPEAERKFFLDVKTLLCNFT